MNEELLRKVIKRLVYNIERHTDECRVDDVVKCPSAKELGCKHYTVVGDDICCECCQSEYVERLIKEILGGADNV